MRKFTFDTWNLVMSAKHNPLKHIPDNNVRHMIMQILAWMWAIVFSFWMSGFIVFVVMLLLLLRVLLILLLNYYLVLLLLFVSII